MNASRGDVDYLRGVLTVTRQVQRAGGPDVEIRAPKYGSERQVIPRDLVELLAAHVAEHRPGDDPARWMFPGGDGHPLHQQRGPPVA